MNSAALPPDVRKVSDLPGRCQTTNRGYAPGGHSPKILRQMLTVRPSLTAHQSAEPLLWSAATSRRFPKR